MRATGTNRSIALLLAVGLVLGGCSGDDGGEAGGGTSYSGATTAATITGSNATTLGSTALGAHDSTVALVSASSAGAAVSTVRIARLLGGVYTSTRSHLAGRGGFTGATETDSCAGGGSLAIVEHDDSTSVSLRACVLGAITVDGDAVLDGDADTPIMTFTRLRLSGEGLDLVLGSSATVQAVGATGLRVSLDTAVADQLRDAVSRFDDVLIVVTDNADGSQRVNLSGRTYNSIEGYVEFETLAMLDYVDDDTTFPSAGVMRITGAGGAAIRITAHPGMVEVALDLDADGNYETLVALDWFTFAAGIDLD